MITFIETIKLIAEVVTTVSAAIIVLRNALKIIPKPIREFSTRTIPVFFRGFTSPTGEKTRFIRAVKAYKAQEKQFQAILKALTANFEMDEIFVLNTSELIKFLSESPLFTKVTQRKQ